MFDASVSRTPKVRAVACMLAAVGAGVLVCLFVTSAYFSHPVESGSDAQQPQATSAAHETSVAKSAKRTNLVVEAALTPPATTGIEQAKPKLLPQGKIETGRASWYKLASATASGESMDGDDFTAAHPSLPIGTRVLVENLDNGRSVIVRINDRGPFAGNRIIDVSKAAAEQLDMIGAGVAKVRVSPIEATVAGIVSR
jgi:rare lipoprotein A (peptidoglycan hydrolase)